MSGSSARWIWVLGIGSTMPPSPDRHCNLTLPRTPLLLIVGNSFGHFNRSWFVYKAVNILGLVTPLISDAIHWRYRWVCQSWAFGEGFVSGLYGWRRARLRFRAQRVRTASRV